MLKPASDKNSNELDNKTFNGTTSVNDTETTGASSLADVPRFVAPTHGGVDILKLLSELEGVVDQSKRLPGGLMFRFDEDKFHMTIMKIRANLPEELKKASKLMHDSERIVEETQKTAQTEIERTKSQASQIKQGAEREAQTVRVTAQSEADRLRAQAKQEGEVLLDDARQKAALMVSDSEIVQRAQIEAQEVIRRAQIEAGRVQQGADDYAREVLGNLEGVLGKAIHVVQRGREVLEKPTPKR